MREDVTKLLGGVLLTLGEVLQNCEGPLICEEVKEEEMEGGDYEPVCGVMLCVPEGVEKDSSGCTEQHHLGGGGGGGGGIS